MIFIPGIVITVATFPGFVMQTVARRFWCDLLRIPVYEAHYFKGTIVHERIDSPVRAAIVAFAPLTVNTILCAILFFPAAFSFLLGSSTTGRDEFFQVLLGWAGISIGMHALPSRGTISDYLKDIPKDARSGFGYYIFRVLGSVFTLIDFLKKFWIDFFYAVSVAMVVPFLITLICMLF